MSYQTVLKPYLIHMGKQPESVWFAPTNELPDWVWAFSTKRWTDNELAVNWLQRVFNPETSPNAKKQRILIFDGHKSHRPGQFQWEYFNSNIHPIYFPAHASHKLQSLDVGSFSPLAQYYGKAVQKHTPTGFSTVSRATFSNNL
jgi:DDE superfamily endonuclease